MIPTKAFPVAISVFKTLYRGKKKLGKASKATASFAAKKGYAKTSKFVTGVSQKAHKFTIASGKWMKKNPKEASFAAGVGTVIGVNILFSSDD
jgi:hypothetical protein